MTFVVEVAYCAISATINMHGILMCVCKQIVKNLFYFEYIYFFFSVSRLRFFHGIRRTDTVDGVLCFKRAD